MKKKIAQRIFLILAVFAVLLLLWRWAYSVHKSQDNLPALTNITVEDLDELKGYRRNQLIDVWSYPDDTIADNQDVWGLSDDQYLLITYGSNGKVEDAEIAVP